MCVYVYHRAGPRERLASNVLRGGLAKARPAAIKSAMAKLYFNYSTMNAGKSTVLLQASHNYVERGMQTYLIIAQFDKRAGEGRIGSRIGIGADADTFRHRTRTCLPRSRHGWTRAPVPAFSSTKPSFMSEAAGLATWPAPSMIWACRSCASGCGWIFLGKLFPGVCGPAGPVGRDARESARFATAARRRRWWCAPMPHGTVLDHRR